MNFLHDLLCDRENEQVAEPGNMVTGQHVSNEPILLLKSAYRRRGTLMPFFAGVAFQARDCAGDLRSTLLTLATLTQRIKGRLVVDQLGKPAEVLRNRCQRELELGTAWPTQSQPAEPQDTLQVRKQHFDTFPVAG
jgi:hypothetical protein